MMIYSGAKEIVEHRQYIFDSFWNTSSSAERKILEIQSNIDLGITEIINSPSRTQELFISLTKSAKSEIPTINAFLREHKIGVMHLLKELSTHEGRRAVNIRILMPTNNTIEKIIKGMKEPTSVSKVPFSSDNYDTTSLNIRHLESQPDYNVTTVTILVLQGR
jgi:phosphatidylserine/phosphatidylglycerophosphate/cardiolipin synthase-like enzyme